MAKIPRVTSREQREAKGLDGFANTHAKTDTGGLKLMSGSSGMKVCSTTPCAECPLRRDSLRGHLGGYSPQMYVDVMLSAASIACHSSPGFQQGVLETQRHCTGIAAWRALMGHVAAVPTPNGNLAITRAEASTGTMRVALVSGLVNPDLYFDSAESFIAHHDVQVKKEP